ncbi:MAG: lipoyl domain-containing protein [Candidatus Omnitrophica bacterium]|nr:lipoyl domain-containing protein [Candidatus Omnitrophota bacterium]
MEFRLPEISQDSENTILTLWHVTEGEKVAEGEDIAEVVTDKATFDVPAPRDGILTKIIKREGEKIVSGEVLGIIE